ncbi:MAG: L-glutamate gamma-semialdehyde dehydrogenase [Gemmatimonadetes bacterium]|nr:L-glutamate gamma-semialdehyde dehydrogenase [Gemmatimonadota bacterium]MYD14819.1 L-glutamate gamma-semialdehyde dehydrogenase [Gemmatimonadota bacterium]MYI65907.1 L-glutamate gamma-semialdehyde dehydrogenase [Gemmatimonadota bacterium]
MSGTIRVPAPENEPVYSYAPGTSARAALKAALKQVGNERPDIPVIIGGEEIRTGETHPIRAPHDHGLCLGSWHAAGAEEARRAIANTLEARREWASWAWEDRVAVFLRAAEMLRTTWRPRINASTMLGQSKNAFQSEIDAACEVIDFFRYGAFFAEQIFDQQPHSETGIWNRLDYRPLEGFVYAVSPFNFTAIGANLAGLPAMVGCGVLWKPSKHAVLSGYYIYRLLEEAGLPPGVINFVPGDPVEITAAALEHRDFAGLHFTGSTGVFQSLWTTVGKNIARYRSYPRLVGETGGKDFILAHPSADADALRTAIVRGSFEYQGQKCSAASRAYVPRSLWKQIRDPLIEETDGLAMGDPADFRNFVNAVIDRGAFDTISGYIDRAAASTDARVIAGGRYSDADGYFIRPTIIEAENPTHEAMCDEIFGPVMSIHVYPDGEWSQTLDLVDRTSPYALTGAVFARERPAVREALERLRYAAGNFYVNDKPTGAVVGQQPFGGGRASGTNDKAGSAFNISRWLSPRSIKENLAPPTSVDYPFMGAE